MAAGCILLGGLVLGAMAGLGHLMPSSAPSSPGSSERQVEVLDHELNYRESGSGEPTIILLHGFGGSGAGWNRVMAKTECGRAIAPDLLGFGASSRPDVAYSLATQGRHLIAFMVALGVQRAVLVGGSMGASVAAHVAAHWPERVRGLVMMAPSGVPGTLDYPPPRGWFYRPGVWNTLALAVVRTPLFAWLYPDSMARQALGVTRSYNEGFTEALSRIRAPTLLLWSRSDRTVPISSSKHYRERIPQLEFLEAPPDAGHWVPGSAPQWTAEAICGFVRRLP